MTDKQKTFIERIAPLVAEYAPKYDIKVVSPIIGQAILESGWGESLLSKVYHNYFGLKCGSKWTGKSVNLQTKEEYTVGTHTTIKANFRVYDSDREGIKGYFEFIQLARYANLKTTSSPDEYMKRIASDGYATSHTYAEDVLKVVDKYGLRKYDKHEATTPKAVEITERDVTLIGHGSGTPAKHNLYSYTTSRAAQKAPNGKHKGIVAVRRLKGITDAERVSFRNTIKVCIGRNLYKQAWRAYVYSPASNGKYYSDCSSIGMATLKKIGRKFSWLYNTAAIYTEDEFEDVPVIIKDGHITNPEVLRVADAVLYRGNDPDRPKQIGHVEWVYDTSSTDAPTPKTSKTYDGKFPSLYNGREDSEGYGWYQKGDGIVALKKYPTQIRRIQYLVNWIDDSTADLIPDGKYGDKTKTKVNICRRKLGLKANGKFDHDLLIAATKYRK